MSRPQFLDDFSGRWRIDRRVRDALAGQEVTGQGTAQFTPDGTGLRYHEALTLVLPGQAQPLTATRSYLWRGQGAQVEILFEDGRLLQRLDLGAEAPQDVHLCDPDRYDGSYDFSGWPIWTAQWRVTGPRKDYVMETRFARG